jgi:hypothetical protein
MILVASSPDGVLRELASAVAAQTPILVVCSKPFQQSEKRRQELASNYTVSVILTNVKIVELSRQAARLPPPNYSTKYSHRRAAARPCVRLLQACAILVSVLSIVSNLIMCILTQMHCMDSTNQCNLWDVYLRSNVSRKCTA